MRQKILLLASLAGLLAGCALPVSNSAPTLYPASALPTVIYLTAQALRETETARSAAAVSTNASATQTPIASAPIPQPTATFTPAPDIPLAAIQIIAPGPASRVASPMDVGVMAVPGRSNQIEAALFGEDGRLLNKAVRIVPGYPGSQYLSLKIPFQIRAVAEVGILQISTKDKHGLIQSLNSARVLLISSGVSQINPAGNGIYERVVLPGLPDRSAVSGGVVHIEGQFLPFNLQPITVELVSDDGQSLGLRALNFNDLTPQRLNMSISYKVSAPTQARLFIRQTDNALNMPIYIYSQEITLNP